MEKAFYYAACQLYGEEHGLDFASYKRRLGKPIDVIIEEMSLRPDFEVYYYEYVDNHIDQIRVCSGIESTLKVLKSDGIDMAIATGKSGIRSREILTTLGLMSHFQLVVGGDEVIAGKPNPEVIYKILSTCKRTPQVTVMIGDSTIDILTAVAANVPSIGTLWTGSDADELKSAGATFTLSDPHYLPSLISDLS